MRILHIIPAFQHPSVRGPHRHYHFLRELSRRHEITLVTLRRSEIPPSALEEVQSYVERLVMFDATPGGSAMSRSMRRIPGFGRRLEQAMLLKRGVSQMRHAVRKLVRSESFDVVLFHGKPVFQSLEGCPDLPVAVDFCDASSLRIRASREHAGAFRKRWLAYRCRRMERIEGSVLGRSSHLAFISPRDRSAVMGEDDSAIVLPNGVDLEYWTRRTGPEAGKTLIFTGVMNYGPNEDAAIHLIEQVLPLVRRQMPDVEVVIAGRDPTERLASIARRTTGVTVTGFVDDLRPYLERATVFAAPLRYGAGMQNKALEALALELPVITTPLVAEGLRVGTALPPVETADNPQSFAASVLALLSDAPRRAALAAEGRRYIEENFDWARSAERLEQLCYAAAGQEQPV